MSVGITELAISDVELDRGSTGLGFNIRGGNDIPHIAGDPGIFVTKVRENGAAFRDGRVREGDRILEINGVNIERVSHNDAVSLFVSAGTRVRLKVQHGAEAYILSRRGQQANADNPDTQTQIDYKKLLFISTSIGILVFIAYKFRLFKRWIK